MELKERNLEDDRMEFAVIAIEATAHEMGISATELRRRLERFDLVKRFLLDCYDTLHTESVKGIVWNVTEALRNRESKIRTIYSKNQEGESL